MGKYIDLTGRVFGEWTVVERSDKVLKDKNVRWLCRCSCGNMVCVNGNSLRSGRSTKCVHCVEPYSKTKYTKDPIKIIFVGMKQRCYYEKHTKYSHYGGRGIKIHQAWLDNPEEFYNWAYDNGYQKGMSIERVDGDKNYEPANCKFINRDEQQKNKRNTIKITIGGQTKILSEWCKVYKVNRNTIKSRVDRGMSYQEALAAEGQHEQSL
jgi:hypothetical protein